MGRFIVFLVALAVERQGCTHGVVQWLYVEGAGGGTHSRFISPAFIGGCGLRRRIATVFVTALVDKG